MLSHTVTNFASIKLFSIHLVLVKKNSRKGCFATPSAPTHIIHSVYLSNSVIWEYFYIAIVKTLTFDREYVLAPAYRNTFSLESVRKLNVFKLGISFLLDVSFSVESERNHRPFVLTCGDLRLKDP